MQVILRVGGLYNLLFALWILGWPGLWFRLAGLEPPRHWFLWYGAAMILGVLGIGCLVASINPLKYWPTVLVGFLSKLFAAGGFAYYAFTEVIPWSMGWFVLINDLVWLVPFSFILWAAVKLMVGRPVVGEPLSFNDAIEMYRLSDGQTLGEASMQQPLAVVFLRHFGCTFTRQLLRSLESMKELAVQQQVRLVLVHMLEEGEEVEYLNRGSIERIADPRCDLYRAFGLGKGGFFELFGLRVWLRGAVAFFRGCGVGLIRGDGLQMPGAFLLKDQKIVNAQRAQTAADLPNVEALFGIQA